MHVNFLVLFSFSIFFPVSQMNPEFSEKVDAILKRSNSRLGRLSVSSKDSKAANLIEVSYCDALQITFNPFVYLCLCVAHLLAFEFEADSTFINLFYKEI